MDDESVAFLKRVRSYHIASIGLLADGTVRTSGRRDGKLVDTTAESIAEHRRYLAEVEELLARARH